MTFKRKQIQVKEEHWDYSKFDQINGYHPLKKAVPESVVEYQARKRSGGRVAFFNFDLAREMNLIDQEHPNHITNELAEMINNTFSIVIINEFDIDAGKSFPKKEICENTYMATRYLQMQHPNKQGKTSGDGRSIWNGQLKNNKGVAYDIMSCGTGATRLSPATHIYNKFFETGDPSISYGCGYAEVDEGLSTLFFSEIFEQNGLATERVLAILKFPNNISITVRAYPNLIRPSHFFNHLKQNNYEALKKMADFYIDRQIANKAWKNVPKGKKKYKYFLEKQSETFAKLVARFETDYIFCWLDWDGDNILMDGGIIDYGSVRQFGLFHHEYRFDDDDRYSTTIKEQKTKGRYTVQCFAQMVDFILKGKKRSIKKFENHSILKKYDKTYVEEKRKLFIARIGFVEKDIEYLCRSQKKLVDHFYRVFCYFERAKSKQGRHEVGDGINWSAIFCMRDILRELPQLYLSREDKITKEEFIDIIKSSYATDEDLELTNYRRDMIKNFQDDYWKIVAKIAKVNKKSKQQILLELVTRSSIINRYDRVTGDSITSIVDKVMKFSPKLNPDEIYETMREFAEYQNFDPDCPQAKKESFQKPKLLKSILQIVRDYREGL
jgi:uncharacterized protein YdiU (UPF0061 family)